MNYIDDDKDTVVIPEQWHTNLAAAIEAAGFEIETKRVKPTRCSCGDKGCGYDMGAVFTHYRVVPK